MASIKSSGLLVLLSLSAIAQNGIGVTPPKVYDTRTLALMLDDLNSQLNRLQFVNQAKLDAAFGLYQGSQSRDVSRAFSVAGGGTAKLTRETVANDTTGEKSATETRETSAREPIAPELPELAGGPSFSPNYGNGPADLLSQQVELSYQAYNLRLVLDRSLSDRLGRDGKPRLQAVLGFTVTLDPSTDDKHAAAFVEVEVWRKNSCSPVSLVSVMPQERTYNASAISTKANAFSGSAVARLFSIGYSERRRGTTFYVYRDSDTVAYTGIPEASATPPCESIGSVAKFGWQFRPVLGRPSVVPGPRDVFATLALPDDDEPESNAQNAELEVRVKTYWRHYDGSLLATKNRRPYTPGWWFQPSPRTEVGPVSLGSVTVPTTAYTQSKLGPEITKATWIPSSNDMGIAVVEGKNFFSSTSVALGQRTIGPGDGLAIKSTQALDVRLPVAAIEQGEPILVGRYGESVPLRQKKENLPGEAIRIGPISLRQVSSASSELTLQLHVRNKNRSLCDFQDQLRQPIIAVGDQIFSGNRFEIGWGNNQPCSASNESLYLRINLPVSQSSIYGSAIRVVYPLWGPSWKAVASIPRPAVLRVDRMNKSGDSVSLLISADQPVLEASTAIQLDCVYRTGVGSPLTLLPNNRGLILTVNRIVLDRYSKLIVLLDGQDPEILDIPEEKPKPKAPVLSPNQKAELFRNESRSVAFKGENLEQITKAEFENIELAKKFDSATKTLNVFVTRKITSKTGVHELILRAADGTMLVAAVKVVPTNTSKPKTNQEH